MGQRRACFTGLWLQKGWQGCRKSLPHPLSGQPFAALAVLTRVLAGPRCRLCRGPMWPAVAGFFFLWNKTVLLTLDLHQLVSPAPRHLRGLRRWAAGELRTCQAALVPAAFSRCQPRARAAMLWCLWATKPRGDLCIASVSGLERGVWRGFADRLMTRQNGLWLMYTECWTEGCWLQRASLSAVLTAISSR